jgi:hypothetical protein
MQEIGFVDLAAARHRDDARAGMIGANPADRLNAVQLRHDDVGDDQVEPIARQQL